MKGKTRNHFIGYGTLERWHQAAQEDERPAPRAYANLIETPTPGQYNISINRLYAIISRLDRDNNVHYCRLRLGSIQMVAGRPLNGDHEAIKERAQQGFDLLGVWLSEQGYEIVPALIAVPNDLTLLDGWADFLAFDKTKNQFHRKGAKAL
jgi:hypothetical protein